MSHEHAAAEPDDFYDPQVPFPDYDDPGEPEPAVSPVTFECAGNMRVVNAVAGDWRLTTFEETTSRGKATFDRLSVTRHEDVLELAVLDGALNAADPDGVWKTSRALTVTLRTIGEHGIRDGLDVAAELIHDRSQSLRHRSGLVAFAGVELVGDTVTAWRCADVETWVRVDGAWEQLLPGDMLTDDARAEYEAAVASASEKDAFAVQETLLDDLALWRYATLGLDSVSHAEPVTVTGVEEVILSSDGAALNPERVRSIADWASRGVHEKPAGHRYPSAHGDLSVIWARRI
jgi:hypothetical protein